MSLSTQTYLLTLYVTYQQESAIRGLFTSNGWLFRTKGDQTEVEDQLNNAVKESTVTALTDSDIKVEYNGDDSPHGNDEFESDREGNDSEETADVADSEKLMPGIEIKVETITDDDDFFGHRRNESLSEQNSAVSNPTPKRKRKEQKAPSKKNKNEKRGIKHHLSASVSEIGVSRKKSVDKTQVQQKQDNDSEDKASASQNSNLDVDLGADPERVALEIQLQETEDIDHYETVHKSLTPDEPFNPPSDVQETNGFSPSLGCYYCHDCGYTFQLQRWYKIHKWNGKCVYTCEVCSEVFTFRNISSYRTHMMKHKKKTSSTASCFISTSTPIKTLLPGKLSSQEHSIKSTPANPSLGLSLEQEKYKVESAVVNSSSGSSSEMKRYSLESFVPNPSVGPSSELERYSLESTVINQSKETAQNQSDQSFLTNSSMDSSSLQNQSPAVDIIMNASAKSPELTIAKCTMEKKHHLKSVTVFFCSFCNYSTRWQGNMCRHKQRMHENRKFSCDQCGMDFKDNYDLKQHVTRIHKNIKLICEVCSKEFNNRHTMYRHKVMEHSENAYYCCHMCGKKFFEKRNYYGHINKHMNAKPYSCSVCKKKFTYKYSMERHAVNKHMDATTSYPIETLSPGELSSA